MFKRLIFIITVILGVNILFAPRINANLTNLNHEDRLILPSNMLCPAWAQLMIDTGWKEQDLITLDTIIYRESRCFTLTHYAKDPNGGSYGLTQINAYWCKPSRYYPNGYLQSFGALKRCEQLLEPRINLLSARLIWLYSFREYGNGWLPWRV